MPDPSLAVLVQRGATRFDERIPCRAARSFGRPSQIPKIPQTSGASGAGASVRDDRSAGVPSGPGLRGRGTAPLRPGECWLRARSLLAGICGALVGLLFAAVVYRFAPDVREAPPALASGAPAAKPEGRPAPVAAATGGPQGVAAVGGIGTVARVLAPATGALRASAGSRGEGGAVVPALETVQETRFRRGAGGRVAAAGPDAVARALAPAPDAIRARTRTGAPVPPVVSDDARHPVGLSAPPADTHEARRVSDGRGSVDACGTRAADTSPCGRHECAPFAAAPVATSCNRTLRHG